jgi:hypothetical protein
MSTEKVQRTALPADHGKENVTISNNVLSPTSAISSGAQIDQSASLSSY